MSSFTVMCCWSGELSQCPGRELCPAGRVRTHPGLKDGLGKVRSDVFPHPGYPKGQQVSGDGTGTNTQNTGPSPGHSLLLQVPRGPSAELLPARGGCQAAGPQ